ncbi:MAG: two-component regulator propeller domain-containing protein [Candidatus Latescibacterota bacterium]
MGAVLQDRAGDLWFATEGGATRYDGKAFYTLTPADGLASSSVIAMTQDRRGDLWLGTWGGGASRPTTWGATSTSTTPSPAGAWPWAWPMSPATPWTRRSRR